MVALAQVQQEGWALVKTSFPQETLAELRSTVFCEGSAGTRCLLDVPLVRSVAATLKAELVAGGILPAASAAIQAIAFDKTAGTNWKVAWHQDLMFPFSDEVTSHGYDLPTRKAGVHFARPPLSVLQELLAVRLHLDDCDATNGPLKVCPRTHTRGLIPSPECAKLAIKTGEEICLAKESEALLMKPLLLHSSSQATDPRHRRVLHVVYHSGNPMTEEWHRKVN